jgi:transcriptional regulator with XRE-family HTH domain
MKIVNTTSVFPPCWDPLNTLTRLASIGYDALDMAFDYCVQEKDFPFMTADYENWAYSLRESAEKLGVSRQAVSKWERAESSPDTDNLIALAQLYSVTLDVLLGLQLPPPIPEKPLPGETEYEAPAEEEEAPVLHAEPLEDVIAGDPLPEGSYYEHAAREAARFGIRPEQAANYHADSDGTAIIYEAVSEAVCTIRSKRTAGKDWRRNIDADYQNRGN